MSDNAITVRILPPAPVATVLVAEQGPPGPRGMPFLFRQVSESAEWLIAHNLGHYPLVSVSDSAGSVLLAQVNNIDVNNLTVSFNLPITGTASCV